jgi:hypothetical protein
MEDKGRGNTALATAEGNPLEAKAQGRHRHEIGLEGLEAE